MIRACDSPVYFASFFAPQGRKVATVAVPPVDDHIVHMVPVDEILPSPRNPRHRLEGIEELAASIAEHQLLQPVVVRRRGRSGYELIAGHRDAAATTTEPVLDSRLKTVTQDEECSSYGQRRGFESGWWSCSMRWSCGRLK